jgi:hypothetical protein
MRWPRKKGRLAGALWNKSSESGYYGHFPRFFAVHSSSPV